MRGRWVCAGFLLVAGAVLAQVGELDFCTVTGRITDEKGRLVKGARVEIRPAAPMQAMQPQSPFPGGEAPPDERMTEFSRDKNIFAWGESDNEGWYHIQGVKKPGAYMLVVRGLKDFRPAEMPLSIALSVGPEFRADVVLRRVASARPTAKKAYEVAIGAAQAAEARGDLAAAINHLEIASDLEPDSPVPHYHLARVMLASGDLVRARKEAGLAVSRNPNCRDCWVVRARIERASGNHGAAREAAEKAIALSPDSIEAYGVLGIVLYETNKFADALPYLEGAVAGGDGDPNVHLFLANTYVRLRQPQLAGKAYRAYLEKFPNAPNRAEVERVLAQVAP